MSKKPKSKKVFEFRDLIASMSLALSFAIIVGNAIFFQIIKFNDFAHLEVNVEEVKEDIKEFRQDISADINDIRLDIGGVKEDVALIKGQINNRKR